MRISKIEAALRQLNAAIRMLFNREDPLAIYSLAAAACQIIRDMSESRRLASLKDYEALLARFKEEKSDALRAILLKRIERFYADHEKPSGATLSNMHVSALVAGWEGNKFWKEFNSNYNFLKHGQHEAECLDNFDAQWPEHIIFLCCKLCCEMTISLSDEMKIFHDWKVVDMRRRDLIRFLDVPGNMEQQLRSEQMEWCKNKLSSSMAQLATQGHTYRGSNGKQLNPS